MSYLKIKIMDISKILKNCPVGTKLYSPILGDCFLRRVRTNEIAVTRILYPDREYGFTTDGRYGGVGNIPFAECVLFPSKENKDWSTFQQSRLAEFSTDILRAELKRRDIEEKAIRQKEFDSAHRCRNCKYFEKDLNSFLSNSHICMARTWGKDIKRHYVVNGSHGLQCKEFVHK